MAFEGGRVKWSIPMVVTSEQQLGRHSFSGKFLQLSRLGGGVDDGVSSFACQGEMRPGQELRWNLLQPPCNCGGMKDGVTRGR